MILIVIASINLLNNLLDFHMDEDVKVLIIDEGDLSLRRRNDALLEGISHSYYGPREREEWFKKRFGAKYPKYLAVIPKKCHAETSFGFLVAYEEEPEFLIELDDDVFFFNGNGLVAKHREALFETKGDSVEAQDNWYNTMENLRLNVQQSIFPRGYPYAEEVRNEKYIWKEEGRKSVLNMGLWTKCPDLDALTIIYNGGLMGRSKVEGRGIKRDKVIIGRDTYFPLCSMNCAFLPKIIPAFYQLFMNFMGIDRFDDIWSGIFLKKVADQMGDSLSLGLPLVRHEKSPRNTFKDLRSELEGIAINEILWKIVDSVDLKGEDYYGGYQELITALSKHLNKFHEKHHRDFIKLQVQKMKLWLTVIDKLT